MKILFISFVVITMSVIGLAIGILLGGPNRYIKGSCGGIANLPGMDPGCGGCACGRSSTPDDADNQRVEIQCIPYTQTTQSDQESKKEPTPDT